MNGRVSGSFAGEETPVRNAVIVDAVRTPIGRGKPGGSLSGLHPSELSSHVLRALQSRNHLDPALVDDVVWGCVTQVGEQSSNIGRWAVLGAGWPDTVPATTVDRACGSSQQATHFAAACVMSGQYDVVVAGGVETMSRVPMGSARKAGPGLPRGPLVARRYGDRPLEQGAAAEQIAEKWGLTREELDRHSVESHRRAAAAAGAGLFSSEIVPVDVVDENGVTHTVSVDEGIRPDSTVEKLAGLATPFKADGVVTAGNASQISDGAAALLIMSEDAAARHGLTPLARFHAFAVTGVDPVLMLTGPIPATSKVLDAAGLSLDDIGAYEVNEAFASVTCAWLAETHADPQLLNAYGGAIALGHPLGASGARLTTTLLNRMRRDGVRYGLQTMCEGGGMANAMVLERL
jgi:acetyl-CoA acyltransferase